MKTLIEQISRIVEARKNCEQSNNTIWFDKHSETLERIEEEFLPHGSGIDCGCKIDLERSNIKQVYINFSFHFMDEQGCYKGWGDFTLKIVPSFSGIDMYLHGKNRDNIKDYLYDVFYTVLQGPGLY